MQWFMNCVYVQLCLHACVCLSTEACIYARVRVSWRMGDSWRTESTPSLVQKAGRRKGGAAQLTALHAPLSVCQERWQWSRTRCPSLSGPKGRVAGVCLWCDWWVEMFQLTSCWRYFKKVCLFASLLVLLLFLIEYCDPAASVRSGFGI